MDWSPPKYIRPPRTRVTQLEQLQMASKGKPCDSNRQNCIVLLRYCLRSVKFYSYVVSQRPVIPSSIAESSAERSWPSNCPSNNPKCRQRPDLFLDVIPACSSMSIPCDSNLVTGSLLTLIINLLNPPSSPIPVDITECLGP